MKIGQAQNLADAEALVQHPDPELDQDAVVLEQANMAVPDEIVELYQNRNEPVPEVTTWCYVLFSSQLMADEAANELDWKRGNPKLTDRRLPILFAPTDGAKAEALLSTVNP